MGKYRHFKGDVYKVIGVARHTETYELLVIYQNPDDDSKQWARPISMFKSDVLLNGKKIETFSFVE